MSYYYYRTFFSDNPKDDYKMHITPDGVSLEYRDGRLLNTKIIPREIFPKEKKLTQKEIRNIHRFIKFKNYEFGQLFDKKMFKKIKEEYFKQKDKNAT